MTNARLTRRQARSTQARFAGVGFAALALPALTACGATPTSGSALASGSVPAGTTSAPPSGPASGAPSLAGAHSPAAATTRTPTFIADPPRVLNGSLGLDASLGGRRPFPADNAWNTRIDAAPLDPRSATLIAAIGAGGHLHPDFGANWDGGPFGIPYIVVSGSQRRVPVSFDYADESDPGPYPIPPNAPIEGGSNSTGDRHVLVLDRDHWLLYELYDAHPLRGGAAWHAGSGAIFRLSSDALRPAGWTSADAAGLPILPGLVRYDEVVAGHIDHALRFTVSRTRAAYLAPARHLASSDPSANLPPMGMRVRLKESFDISGYPTQARIVLQALKEYGMIVADNGSDWYLSGAADKRWNDDALNTLKGVPGSAFEVVRMGTIVTS